MEFVSPTPAPEQTLDQIASRTLVLQSHQQPPPFEFLSMCMRSVSDWAASHDYAYRCLGDELFTQVPAGLMDKTRATPVIATDIGRLQWLQQLLADGWSRVVWVDADVLVMDPTRLLVPDVPFAVGREHWVQFSKGRLRLHTKVHNALLVVSQGDSFLPFYLDTAIRLIEQHSGQMPPQYIGPKLLTALHNIVQLPVVEAANMLPTTVARELLQHATWSEGSGAIGPAWQKYRGAWKLPPAALNLCASAVTNGEITPAEMLVLTQTLAGRQKTGELDGLWC